MHYFLPLNIYWVFLLQVSVYVDPFDDFSLTWNICTLRRPTQELFAYSGNVVSFAFECPSYILISSLYCPPSIVRTKPCGTRRLSGHFLCLYIHSSVLRRSRWQRCWWKSHLWFLIFHVLCCFDCKFYCLPGQICRMLTLVRPQRKHCRIWSYWVLASFDFHTFRRLLLQCIFVTLALLTSTLYAIFSSVPRHL